MTTPSNKDILAAPGDFTVPVVTEAFEQSGADDVDVAKLLERDGKGRAGILDWTPPAADTEDEQETEAAEPSYSRERVLSYAEGTLIVGEVPALGRSVTYPEIVGALHGDTAESFTRPELHRRIVAFHAHEEE